jgi:hypothetical protein
VDQPGDHILADSRIAGDQHRDPGRTHLVDQKLDFAHRPGIADELDLPLLEAAGMAEYPVFTGQQHPLMGLLHHQVELLKVERLADEITGAKLHGLDRAVDIAMTGNHHHFDMEHRLLDFDQEIEIMHIRQSQVHDNHIEPVVADHLHGRGGICRGQHIPRVALQFLLQ